MFLIYLGILVTLLIFAVDIAIIAGIVTLFIIGSPATIIFSVVLIILFPMLIYVTYVVIDDILIDGVIVEIRDKIRELKHRIQK